MENEEIKPEIENVNDESGTPPEIKPEEETIESLKANRDHWKAFARKHEAEKKTLLSEKSNWEKAQKDFEKNLSGLTEKLNEKETVINQITFDNMKTKVAKEHNLSDDLVEFLTATDEEGLSAQAEKLASKVTITPVRKTILTQGLQSQPSTDPYQAIIDWQKVRFKK